MDEKDRSLRLTPTVESMLQKVIKDRNSGTFKRIAQEFHLNFNYCFQYIPPLIALIQHLVQENFVPAVEFILSRPDTNSIESIAPRTAFDYATRHGLRDVVIVYIRAVLEDAIHCISLDEAFVFALEMKLYSLASEVSKDPEFRLNVIPSVRHRTPPLHLAVLSGEPSMVEDLLNTGAKVDIEDHRGYTALMLGCTLKSYDCCRVLLMHGADPNHRNPTCSCASTFHAVCTTPGAPMHSEVSKVRLLQLLRMFGLRTEIITGPNIKPSVDENTTAPSDKEVSLDETLRMFDTPPSLRVECCRLIRRHLVRVHRGLSVLKFVDCLPLPSIIIRTYFKCD